MALLSGELNYPTEVEAIGKRLAAISERGDDAVFVAQSAQGHVVGWAHVFIANRIETDRFAELGGLVVSGAVRRQGVGRQLVAAAETWAKAQRTEKLRVRCNIVREEAHAFYRQLGYETLKHQAVFSRSL